MSPTYSQDPIQPTFLAVRMIYSCFPGETTPDTSKQPAGHAEGLSDLSGVSVHFQAAHLFFWDDSFN